MSTAHSQPKISEERRGRLMLGELPDDFLRLGAHTPSDGDQQLALALDQQLNRTRPNMASVPAGSLKITVDQAKLIKSYGLLSKMDPYVRLRVGHYVYETHTDSNGGKNPRWNKVVQCPLHKGVHTVSVEIYDEYAFKMDELIAWAQIPIPQSIFTGETHEEWFPLSGKQGEGQEGAINLVLSYSRDPPMSYGFGNVPPLMYVPRTGGSLFGGQSYAPLPVYPAPCAPAPPSAAVTISEEDFKIVEEMFPNIDKDVIKTVLEANSGNREAAVNSLLQMS